MPNSDKILKVEGLSHSFRDSSSGRRGRDKVLEKVSFSIERGSFVSIMGPSGCGKSTLLRFVAGLETPEKGVIERHWKELAMVFQNHAIFPWLTVAENAGFGLEMKGVARKEIEAIVRAKLEEVGLVGTGAAAGTGANSGTNTGSDLSHSYPNQLSGGQKQRVSVARALAVSPEILIMDEPFSSLDSITSEKLKADIFRLFKKYGMTVLMVNHLIEDAIELSDEIIVLSKRPGTIKERIRVDLPYPRDNRSTHFFALVDRIRSLIEE